MINKELIGIQPVYNLRQVIDIDNEQLLRL